MTIFQCQQNGLSKARTSLCPGGSSIPKALHHSAQGYDLASYPWSRGWIQSILALVTVSFLFCLSPTDRACAAEETIRQTETGRMLVKEGLVKFQPPAKVEMEAGQPQPLGFGDALHTLQLARATVRFADLSDLRMRELTRLEITRRANLPSSPGITLREGQIYFANRGAVPRAISIETPYVRGTPRGTEFLVAVDLQARRTVVTMF